MEFSVQILGSSAATPTTKRGASAMLVNLDYTLCLMDCGEGTQIQLRRYKIKLSRIKHIFISHLHGDHFFGLIGLISTFHLLGRKEKLDIYGPTPLKEILDLQLQASQTSIQYPLNFHPTNPDSAEIIFENDEHFVKTFPLDHRIETTGFLFGEKQKPRKLDKAFLYDERVPVKDIIRIKKGEDYVSESGKVYRNDEITTMPPPPRTFAYCSDTRYFEEMATEIKNVDLLYHESTFMEDMKSVAQDKFHSTALEAATIATKAGAKKLIIGHFSARYREMDKMLEEARNIFTNTELAEDGKRFEV
jgi:ribonuclease Z